MSPPPPRREREQVIRRQAAVRGACIAATGFVLPIVVLWATWLVLWIIDVGPLARARLGVVLRPPMSEVPAFLLILAILALPFVVQGAVAARTLVTRGKKRQRAEWRAAGCFAGLCVSTVVVFATVAPNVRAWVHPGLDVPASIVAVHYAGALAGGLVGRALGPAIGRRHFRKRRHTAAPGST